MRKIEDLLAAKLDEEELNKIETGFKQTHTVDEGAGIHEDQMLFDFNDFYGIKNYDNYIQGETHIISGKCIRKLFEDWAIETGREEEASLRGFCMGKLNTAESVSIRFTRRYHRYIPTTNLGTWKLHTRCKYLISMSQEGLDKVDVYIANNINNYHYTDAAGRIKMKKKKDDKQTEDRSNTSWNQ